MTTSEASTHLCGFLGKPCAEIDFWPKLRGQCTSAVLGLWKSLEDLHQKVSVQTSTAPARLIRLGLFVEGMPFKKSGLLPESGGRRRSREW